MKKMSPKARKIFAVFIAVVLISTVGVMTAYATDDPIEVVNNLSTFIFGLIRAIGLILLGWGIVQVGIDTYKNIEYVQTHISDNF